MAASSLLCQAQPCCRPRSLASHSSLHARASERSSAFLIHQSFCPRSLRISKSQWPPRRIRTLFLVRVQSEPLDLTEENVQKVLLEARTELLQLFDTSVGITGVAELADLDGPFVKLRLKGRFWHQRSIVLARLANFLQKRIPELLEVEIEDQAQLDDSPANF